MLSQSSTASNMRARLLAIIFFGVAVFALAGAYQYWVFNSKTAPSTVLEREFNLAEAGILDRGIPAIDHPVFESTPAADVYLKDEGLGLVLSGPEEARFYPFQILAWHEAVNDEFNGEPVLVTYCPMCGSGAVFDRRVRGRVLEFSVSAKVWNNNLVLFDRETQTLWNQILALALAGEMVGEELIRLPAPTMTWQAFKKTNPQGRVLSRQTSALRDYTRNPYGDFDKNQEIKFPLDHLNARFPMKQRVYWLNFDNQAFAYLNRAVAEELIVNQDIADQPLVLVYSGETDSVRAFSRIINGKVLTFTPTENGFTDQQTNNQWSFDGQTKNRESALSRLDELPLSSAYWFCLAAAFPNLTLHLP